jgi:uncharacterized cofD-like protein
MKKVVTIGGGTGSFVLLSGLKQYPIELFAIVSMADDGGSTGVLRDELGVLPPGDVRQCLVALSDSPDMLRRLMNYRFTEGGLDGHSFGNLFLSALEKITGSFSRAVEEAADILDTQGTVIPVTSDRTQLIARLSDGRVIEGEHAIDVSRELETIGVAKLFLRPRARATKEAIAAILAADLVILGPGDHYGSVLPNLLVAGIPQALRKTRAKIVYNCNLVNKAGHTTNFTLDDYVDALHATIGKPVIDYVTFNTEKPAKPLERRYEETEHRRLVVFRPETRKRRNYRVVQGDLLSREVVRPKRGDRLAASRAYIRHDPEKLAKMLMILLELSDYETVLRKMI